MIQPKDFIETLRAGGIEFFAGVPDSLLKNLCAYITDSIARENNIIVKARQLLWLLAIIWQRERQDAYICRIQAKEMQ